MQIAADNPHLGLLRPERCEGGHRTVYAGRREADVVMTSFWRRERRFPPLCQSASDAHRRAVGRVRIPKWRGSIFQRRVGHSGAGGVRQEAERRPVTRASSAVKKPLDHLHCGQGRCFSCGLRRLLAAKLFDAGKNSLKSGSAGWREFFSQVRLRDRYTVNHAHRVSTHPHCRQHGPEVSRTNQRGDPRAPARAVRSLAERLPTCSIRYTEIMAVDGPRTAPPTR